MRHHAYDLLTYNAPLSAARAASLVEALGTPTTALDLGCGWAQLLVDVLVASPATTGIGVDLDPVLLARGRSLAEAAGVGDRMSLVEGDVTEVDDTTQCAIAIGVSHAWGGTAGALDALLDRVEPGGRLLLGDGGWMGMPTDAAVDVLGDLPPLADLPGLAEGQGWIVHDVQHADADEWDAFEDGWASGLERWAERGEPGADDARALAADHRAAYREIYRGLLGFAYLVLEAP